MPNRFAVLPTDFALNPQVRAAGHRAGWTWFLVATAATACTPPADTAPRLNGAAQWSNASWRCLGVSRREVDRATACGLLRWDGDDLVVLGMGTHFDKAEADAAPRSAALLPGPGGMSAAAREQRRAAVQARWAKQRAGDTGRTASDAEPGTVGNTESDTGRIAADYGPHGPSPSPPSREQHTEPEKTGDRARVPAGSGATGQDTDGIRPISPALSVSDAQPVPDGDAWATVRNESWVGLLLHAGAKCGAKNWPAWKSLCDAHGVDRVVEVARSIEALVRWPDRVEDALKRLGSQRPTGAAIAHKVIRVQT